MEHLKVFHRDVLTVRSDQWKYYIEPYTGCPLQCTYCLYWESQAFLRQLRPPVGFIAGVERDLAALPKRLIIYIGATVDPYQLLEKTLRVTRQVLERLADRGLPVVMLTKSPLVLRDLDLLSDLNRRGLVLVQFTVLTTNEAKARLIERGAPAVADRLAAAERLACEGIPVHVHLSPVIPGLYEERELEVTVRAISAHGGECIYSNILGMRHRNTKVWFDSVAQLPPPVSVRMRTAYATSGDPEKNVYSPSVEVVHDEMSRLRDVCGSAGIDFICECIPALDLFDPARFEQGIFRFGLPTVYQMMRLFDATAGPWQWAPFRDALSTRFPAVDDEYLCLLRELWDDGQLFEKTPVRTLPGHGERTYARCDQLDLAAGVFGWD